METGLNSIEDLLTPARGFRSSRHTCRKPLLFDPAQSACHQGGGGPLPPSRPWSGLVSPRLGISLGLALIFGSRLGAAAFWLILRLNFASILEGDPCENFTRSALSHCWPSLWTLYFSTQERLMLRASPAFTKWYRSRT